jgi:hypothetical protein
MFEKQKNNIEMDGDELNEYAIRGTDDDWTQALSRADTVVKDQSILSVKKYVAFEICFCCYLRHFLLQFSGETKGDGYS